MEIYINGMGPLQYKGIELGYYASDDIVLTCQPDSFKSKYYSEKKQFSVDNAERFVRNVENNWLMKNLYKWGLGRNSAKYKAAQSVLRNKALENFNVLDYIVKRERKSREFVNYLTNNASVA